jgi:hypothetical protein
MLYFFQIECTPCGYILTELVQFTERVDRPINQFSRDTIFFVASSNRRWIDVQSMSKPQFNVDPTLFKRNVSAGTLLLL